jgi:aminoglycoside phosphotransferase (APT) family kinase protein
VQATFLSIKPAAGSATVVGMVDPVPLASGRDADVFAVDARRVLRRYRDGGGVAAEVSVMAYVAGLGFPVPTVYEAHGTDLVMERLDGPTMLAALAAGDLELTEGAALLADLHHQLHTLPPRLSTEPGARVLHLDLHPDNIMLSQRGPVVIDWRNAAEGPADLDLALSAVILAQVAVDRTHVAAAPAGTLLTAFLQRAGGNPRSALDEAVAIRRANPNLTAEEVGLLTAATALIIECAPAHVAEGR